MKFSLMIVDDLNVIGTAGCPAKDDPPLRVDPDAVEPGEIALERLQSIARRGTHIIEGCRGVEHIELAWGDGQHLGW